MTSYCPLCCNDWIGEKTKDLVRCTCPYCEFAVCEGCTKTYVLSSPNDPRCMNPDCGHDWSVNHVYNMLPSSFIKGAYKTKREDLLYDREIAMMQATQYYVNHNLYELQQARPMIATIVFIGRCSSGECKGYINAIGCKCGLCATKYCDKCMSVSDNKHVCNPDDVATCKLLKKDTKPCPTCATPIFRTEGCSQMFCTQCNVVFDWFTMKIEQDENRMHNPYYYAWRAGGGGVAVAAVDPADVVCQEGDQIIPLSRFIAKIKKSSMSNHDKLTTLTVHRVLSSVKHIDIPHVELREIPVFQKNIDLRIRYLKNEVDIKRFKALLQMREKAANKKKEIWQILSAFHSAGQDLMNEKSIDTTFVIKFKRLFKYTCEALEGVSKRYTCKVPDLKELCDLYKCKHPEETDFWLTHL